MRAVLIAAGFGTLVALGASVSSSNAAAPSVGLAGVQPAAVVENSATVEKAHYRRYWRRPYVYDYYYRPYRRHFWRWW